MNGPLRQLRSVFLLFLGAAFVALMAGLPLVVAQTQEEKKPAAAEGATAPAPAPAPEHPGFEQADRNKDGFVDKSESGVVPGLSANFERADRNRDGRLDKAEFEKGLQILEVRR
jgi:hypothetical protein